MIRAKGYVYEYSFVSKSFDDDDNNERRHEDSISKENTNGKEKN